MTVRLQYMMWHIGIHNHILRAAAFPDSLIPPSRLLLSVAGKEGR